VNHYLYAIVDRLPARWRPPTAGIAGAAVVPLRMGDLVILSSLLESIPVSGPRMLAVHQDVVASVIDAPATLPFGYGTAVPAPGLEDWLATHRSTLTAALGAVRGCVEMAVKLLRLEGAIIHPRSGRGPVGRDEPALRALADALIERAALAQWRYRPSGSAGNVAAAVSFLVPRADLGGFLARIAPVASHAADVAVVPTGPWAPYSFVPDLGRPPLARVPVGPFEVVGRRAG
jgi:hypothetical protein